MRTATADGRLVYRGDYDDDLYWRRVERNLGWMGNTEEEWRANQERLRDATIGIAGTGGIGGAAAIRLVRMGARNLKVADPELFDVSNIQRQAGASLDNVGRNKAEVVAEMAFELTRDVNIEVFTDGINADTAADFVEGCDVVSDQMEIYEIDHKYALHRAFRASETCRAVLAVATVAHGALVHKYTRESATIEDVYGIPEEAGKNPEVALQLVQGQVPDELMPAFPSRESVYRWAVDQQIVPIFGPSPATCEGILLECICREVMDLPGAVPMPVRPGYAFIDTYSWTAKIVHPEDL